MPCDRPVPAPDEPGPGSAAPRQFAAAAGHTARPRLPNHFLPPAWRGFVPVAAARVRAGFHADASGYDPGRPRVPPVRPPAPPEPLPTAPTHLTKLATS